MDLSSDLAESSPSVPDRPPASDLSSRENPHSRSVSTGESRHVFPGDSSAPVTVRLEEISKIYGSGNTEVRALDGISLSIQQGTYCAIMGSSGSGKSTAMNVIGCLDRPTSGRYYLDGLDVSQLADSDLAQIRNRKLGFVFQQYHLLPQLSALDNVMLPMVYANVPQRERRERAITALERVGLGNRLYNRPNQLSGGQQQRVSIARAIVNHPVLLLADEPTGALDSKTTAEVLDLFRELNESGITLVVVTHEPDVGRTADRIIWFRDGCLLHDNLTPDAIEAMLH